MGEREALLRAVCENPDDDLTRLVFADWLEEHGDPERATHIRLQVRLTELFMNPGMEIELPDGQTVHPQESSLEKYEEVRRMTLAQVRAREREVWAVNGGLWRLELPYITGVRWFEEFHRGFVERVTVEDDALLVRHADAVLNLLPIRHLSILSYRGASGFADIPGLSRLKTLTLANSLPTEAVFAELLRCDSLNESMLLFIDFGLTDVRHYRALRAHFGDRLRWPHPQAGEVEGPTWPTR